MTAKQSVEIWGGGYTRECDPLSVIIEPLHTHKKYKKVPYYIKNIKGGEVL